VSVVVRTDASVAIGLGHAMRCLALTAALDGGRAVFVMAGVPAAFAARARDATLVVLAAEPGTPDDADETARLARAEGVDWVVVDGYQFGGDYQQRLVDAGLQVLVLDDHGHASRYPAHLVLNQNFGAGPEPYARRAPHTRLLLGPRYALLRSEFRDVPERAVAERAERVLVTLGGSDPDNVSTHVLAGLAAVPRPLEVQVLIGGANPYRPALEQAAAASAHDVTLVADARDVAARMAWADIAVAAAGGTARELACVGTPQISIVLADNQRPAGSALAEAGLAVGLGWHADVTEAAIGASVAALIDDAPRRAMLAARGRELIDGRGAQRVLEAMGLVEVPA
jgi:UDP-2,4-diacetamido-2,4,6-trideoxy-beta-L-altropyranose hydrolase